VGLPRPRGSDGPHSVPNNVANRLTGGISDPHPVANPHPVAIPEPEPVPEPDPVVVPLRLAVHVTLADSVRVDYAVGQCEWST